MTDPFPGLRKPLSNPDLIRALRLDLAAELDAVNLYEAHADATDIPEAQILLRDIANEEKVHAGELLELISILTGREESNYQDKGREEARRKVYNPV
jgi:rubrerythrin